jgi:hypothetical protein
MEKVTHDAQSQVLVESGCAKACDHWNVGGEGWQLHTLAGLRGELVYSVALVPEVVSHGLVDVDLTLALDWVVPVALQCSTMLSMVIHSVVR